MKKYEIWVICPTGTIYRDIVAEYFHTITNNSSSSGYYAFYKDKELIACYPIEKTVIEKITKIE